METFWKDMRFALRTLGKSPAFTLIAVLALGLGIGANTAIFSVFNGMLWRPLPAKNPQQLVVLAKKTRGLEFALNLSYPDFLDYRELKKVFSEVSAEAPSPVNFGVEGSHERAWTTFVSGNYFSMLGIEPARGRLLAADEGWVPGKDAVVMLSYKYWQRRFGGNPAVIGQTVEVNQYPFTIIGVTPENFHGTYFFIDSDFYLPIMMLPQLAPGESGILQDRTSADFRVLARLQPGVTVEQAKAAAVSTSERLAREYPDTHKDMSLVVYEELKARPEPGLGDFMGKLAVAIMSLVGMVLLIACANVANLILARANGRRKELATRTALGASPWRMARQLLTESILLAMVGGIAGLVFSRWAAMGFLSIHIPTDIPVRLFDMQMDWRVFAFSFLAALITGILAGVIPAFQAARADLAETLKEGGRSGGSTGRHRLRAGLVIAQVAVSLVLLAGSGFFIRSFQNSARVDMGFRTDHILMLSVDARLQGYSEQHAQKFYEQLGERVKALRGVRDAAIASFIPMGYNNALVSVFPQGQATEEKRAAETVLSNSVQPDYFRTLGVPVIHGREFTVTDTAAAPRVAIVNEAFAKKIWPGQDALGKVFRTEKNGPAIQVVGLTRTGKYTLLYESPQPYVYFPLAQVYNSLATVLVYSEGDPARLVDAVREQVRGLDSTMPIYGVMTMESHVRYGKPLLPARLGAIVVGAFGLLGVVLATIGVYGVVAYSVSQRTQEIGIRTALGAQRFNVVAMVVRQGMTLALAGMGIGLVLAVLLARALSAVLYGVKSVDVTTLGLVSGLLLAVGFLASYVPALRATHVDPVVALRHE